jgi:hypothetical protein
MDYYNEFDNNLASVIDSLKQLLYERHPDIFERIEFQKDEIYLEPLLYTYVNQDNNKWLDSIIYGYEINKKQHIEVFSNSDGIVYLPNFGYLKTDSKNDTFSLITDDNDIILLFDNKEIPFEFEGILRLECGIEMLIHQHPLIEDLFIEQDVKVEDIIIENIYSSYIDFVNRGINLIEKFNPEHFSLLKKNLKKIMLFRGRQPNCFAIMKAHCMIFLNVKERDKEIFFVDHISHEGAHVTFNTITYESKYNLFKHHFNENFATITGNEYEHSSIYLRFHGLFTYYEIIKGIERCMKSNDFSIVNMHEIKGRFVFLLSRYKTALEVFQSLDVFKEEGLKWMNIFKTQYDRLEAEHGEMLNHFIIDEQPYDFNSQVFLKQNPILIP